MADKKFITTEDPKGELDWINLEYHINQHVHMEKDIPVLLMTVSLKSGFPSFKRIVFKFRSKFWGRVLLSINQTEWYETLLLEYEDLSYGAVSMFMKLQLLEDTFTDKLPELDIEVVK